MYKGTPLNSPAETSCGGLSLPFNSSRFHDQESLKIIPNVFFGEVFFQKKNMIYMMKAMGKVFLDTNYMYGDHR